MTRFDLSNCQRRNQCEIFVVDFFSLSIRAANCHHFEIIWCVIARCATLRETSADRGF